ncbi:LysM peptidoglycan-binding domain-containing protein [Ensifer sp. ENS02]|uniref:LysM peptidoglycan-binding domain-containing protein n=1 Tax=Ensifer sp. ENS02 TaxID=2769290 RepID=UPI0017846238|nr:LysM domain-containing protein [Ensifer sp. ENS02]MBD9524715.1 LysM peptidoglycan-binding domain-containing protein [Ensifer sp. ENS02]
MTRMDFEYVTRGSDPAPASPVSGPFRAFIRACRQIRAITETLRPPGQEEVFSAFKTMGQSRERADEMRRPFLDKAPETDPAGWNYYLGQKAAADDDESKARQAVSGYLRVLYGGDPKRAQGMEAAARDIAYRFRDDALAQTIVTSALQSVRTETAAMRKTDQSLQMVGLAGSKADGLAEQEPGQTPPISDFPDVENNLALSRQMLVNALIAEFDEAFQKAPAAFLPRDLDPADRIWQRIGDRYKGDPELANAVDAARVIKQVLSAPPAFQLSVLGAAMQPSFDPSARAIVVASPRIIGILDDYVRNAIQAVSETFHKEGPVAAAKVLRDRADGDLTPGVTRETSARIVNGLVATDLRQILVTAATTDRSQANAQRPPLRQDQLSGFAVDLAATLDFIGADTSPVSGQWRSDGAKTAVEGVARTIAHSPDVRLYGFMLEDGVAAGYPTLALATADELRKLGPTDLAPVITNGNTDRRLTTTDIFRAINAGQKRFSAQCKETYDKAAEHAGQFGNPAFRYEQTLTPDQLAGGRDALRQANPKHVAAMQEDRKAIDALGYRILRMSESVTFYQAPLGKLREYSDVELGRSQIMEGKEIAPLLFLSDQATRRIGTQAAHEALLNSLPPKNVALPQTYGVRAQMVGDMAEFLAETYVVRGVNSGENMERVGPVPLGATEEDTRRINATRVGHLPFFAGPAIWGIGGTFQAALTVYLYDKVKFDPGQEWRKPILLGLVGGFAAFHLLEGAMAMARLRPHMFDGLPALREAMKQHTPWVFCEPGSRRDIVTRDVVEPTPRLIGSLVGLMAVATVWDTSGVVYNAGKDNVKTWTHGVNLFNDAVLLRLQVRELAKRLMQSPALREGVYKSVIGSLSQSKVVLDGIEAVLRRVPVIGTNPIGWLVNIGYLSTTLINWGVDQDRAITKSEAIERTFLEGAVMPAQSVDLMSQFKWWSGDPKSAGLARAFHEMGGDPAGFYQWLSALGPTEQAMDASAEYVAHLDKGEAKMNQPDQAYLALPEDPRKIELANYSYIGFNTASNRWEDPTTHSYWETNSGLWRFDRRIGSPEMRLDPMLDEHSHYDPKKRRLTYSSSNSRGLLIESATGLENWLHAHGAPLLPRPNSYAQQEPPPAVTVPDLPASEDVAPINLYTVRPGDNLDRISNGDATTQKAILEANPWLNADLFDQKGAAERHGRNPNLLLPGDRLLLPPGHVVAT